MSQRASGFRRVELDAYQTPHWCTEALIAHIGGFQSMMPGHTIDIESGVDTYGTVFRFAWVMRNGGDVAHEGVDFGELAADGRIRRIIGFFGPFPPLSP